MKIFNVKRKKASLSLSLNAIVILVLAIAMLGLGLTFIRGIFKGITAKVEEAVAAGEITNPPTRDTPVTITPSKIDIRQTEKSQVKVAFLNPEPDERKYTLNIVGGGALGNIDCPSGDTAYPPLCEVKFVYNDASFDIKKDDINLYVIAIDPIAIDLSGAAPETYIFTAEMVCSMGTDPTDCSSAAEIKYTKNFVIVVKP